MKIRGWTQLAGSAALVAGAGLVIRDLRPEGWTIPPDDVPVESVPASSTLPCVDVTFLRCGVATVLEIVEVRGGGLKPVTVAHSAVLVRHPQVTVLYDTGLCGEIDRYLERRPFVFRHTLARFTFERALGEHLRRLNLAPSDLTFALISHLHWDHVGGVPDLPGVTLRINRVEHEAAQPALLDANRGLVRQLMRANPVDLFDLAGPAYEGFPSSHDLLGDGSLVLVPLPGHTAGQTGLFVNRSNGPRLFLIGDAAHVAANYVRPATMHPYLWSAVTWDDAAARQTLIDLHRFARRHPDVALIAMHDAAAQADIASR